MQQPVMSSHFQSRLPSDIRLAQIEFEKRTDKVSAINLAIGNVILPMHPAMIHRLHHLDDYHSPFKEGVVKYTTTSGMEETKKAFLNIIASSGFETKNLYSQITDGGSQGMELVILGVCGPAGTHEKPLLLIDAAYTNYVSLAKRVGRDTVSIQRHLLPSGKFSLPDITEIREVIEKTHPGGLIVIPYDNPTGQLYEHQTLILLAQLCVEYNMWMISDEAYRELFYTPQKTVSIWGITNNKVPGIEGRRISIETTSKVWNACGLRIGAVITDNREFHERCVYEQTSNLCANAIGQYIFGALAQETHPQLQEWYSRQKQYYQAIMTEFTAKLKLKLPGIIVSSPDAAIYSVIDVRNIAKPGFNGRDFVNYCTKYGKVMIDGKLYTLLVAPMEGFYNTLSTDPNPGVTQLRVAYVETPAVMKIVPDLFIQLFQQYEHNR